MISARPLTFLALLFSLLLAGCQSPSSVGEIAVTVVDIKPTGSSLFESRAIMTLRFINENIMPVAFSNSTHKLYLNGTYVGNAVNNQPVGLAPTSTQTLEVALFLENLKLINQLSRLSQSNEVSYRLTSTLSYQAGDEKDKIKADTSGSIDLTPLLNSAR